VTFARTRPAVAALALRRAAAIGLAAVLVALGAPASAQTTAGEPPVAASGLDGFAASVREASLRFGVPAAWIAAVMRAESFGNPRAVSPKGAMGLMQIMPRTWPALRARYRLGADPFDPRDNLLAGAAYLRELFDRYGPAGFLAAYNAGPARWEDHLATGRPLPAETRTYLARLAPTVGGEAAPLAAAVRSWTQAALFPVPATALRDDETRIAGAEAKGAAAALFIPVPREVPSP
jgi:soluble lytic murein transglycosylase-like protein